MSAKASMKQKKKGSKKPGSAKRPLRGGVSGIPSVGAPRIRSLTAAAAISTSMRRVGMSDVSGHTMSWLAGYTYVGDGSSLGVAGQVYFVDPTKTTLVIPATGLNTNGNVPLAPADGLVGATYCADVLKHYPRIRVRRCGVELAPLLPSTGIAASVIIAPQRGASSIGAADSKDFKSAGNQYTNVLSMSGAVQVASWESGAVDLTPYIAGGSGARQNEFATNGDSGTTIVSGGSAIQTVNGIVPCTFAISGTTTGSGQNGGVLHAVICTMVVDLLDFIGGNAITDPAEVREARRAASVIRPKMGPGEGLSSFAGRPPDAVRGTDQKAAPPLELAMPALVRELPAPSEWEIIELSGQSAVRHKVTGRLLEVGTGVASSKVTPGK